ncbi:S41 family peptidase [Paludisphaera rhizosphaerae]|uniref:S41 family peptidase n=1 Tax=Paludisphaera rhizosphaerae TaxID=2711216 RepID=UPI0013EB1D0D|nr:S41 family peptidase [Paludisphaera rhizosphaerae]
MARGWKAVRNLALIVIAEALLPAAVLADDWSEHGRQIVAAVGRDFYDANRARAWVARHEHYADQLHDRDAFTEATRRVLKDLQASHTAYFTKDDPEYYGLACIFQIKPEGEPPMIDSIGVDVAPGGFVRKVFAASPAEFAGLRRGDEIVSADGEPFRPVVSFRGKAGRGVVLEVRSREGEPPRRVVVTPGRTEPQREWLADQRHGAKVIERKGRKIAYMPMFSAAGEEPQSAVRDAILGKFAEADALVLDFRGGWGGADPGFVSLFDRSPPVLETVASNGVRSRYAPHWRKPLVLLINGGSRSGKEIVAFAVRKHRLGTLVGERTAGAVLAGQALPVGDGLLYLAGCDVLVDGERLEGVGVPVDVEVADRLRYAEGADPQLDAALDEAATATR